MATGIKKLAFGDFFDSALAVDVLLRETLSLTGFYEGGNEFGDFEGHSVGNNCTAEK